MFGPRPPTPEMPSLAEALVPVAALVGLLGLSFHLFGDGAAAGPNQIALLFCVIIATFVAWRHGHSIESLRDAATTSVTAGLSSIFILLAVGALIGTWAMSGTLIAMVYYGLRLLDPDYFYMTACLLCAVIAFSIGSSWTVAGTIGIGLMGIAQRMGLDPAITAGAVISGAYFGDKMSPLSDTTNLAPAVTGIDIFTHIQHMVWTTAPSFLFALVAFAVAEQGEDAVIGVISTTDTRLPSAAYTEPMAPVPMIATRAMLSSLFGQSGRATLAPERAAIKARARAERVKTDLAGDPPPPARGGPEGRGGSQ